jgi:hypothetical protein
MAAKEGLRASFKPNTMHRIHQDLSIFVFLINIDKFPRTTAFAWQKRCGSVPGLSARTPDL